MSHTLVNRVKPLTGYGMATKAVLYQLADISKDGETVFFRIDQLCIYVDCCRNTVKSALRKLEQKEVLIPLDGSPKGRGHIHYYRFNLTPAQPSSSVEVPTTEPPAPANGHKPTEEERAMEQVKAWFPKATEQVARARERIAKKR